MRAALLLVFLVSWTVATSAQPRRTLRAAVTGGADIEIDGRLDELIWETTEEGSSFVERVPVPGRAPPVDSHVRVLFDAEALYVGVRMELLPGERPRALSLARDSFLLFSDDAVTVKIDVARDRRTTIGLAVNPAGTQLDYVAVENGRQFRTEYDAVWEVATSVDETSWTAEYRIPFEALGLPEQPGPRVLGLNVTRDHSARVATDDWSPIPPEFGPVSAVHYGDLVGLSGVGTGRSLTLVPYGRVTLGHSNWASSYRLLELWAGGDARLRVGEDVWSELTVFTDFAQVDLDDPVVNLDRFPLFFPEKRPFFLTGLDIFEYGEPGVAQIFFSRRIGLDAYGGQLPIYGGFKLYGHEGPIGFGLLDVLTGEPRTNYAVARVRSNFTQSSYLGVIGTMREPSGEDADRGYAFGVDGSFRALSERLQASAAASMTTGGAPFADRLSGRAELRWRGAALTPSASILYVGDDFDPDIGFVLRQGLLRTVAALPWIHRTDIAGLESVTLEARGQLDTSDEADLRLGASTSAALTADWPAWGFSISGGLSEDVVEAPFELLPSLSITPGAYRGGFSRYRLFAKDSRNPSGELSYYGSSAFFGGVIHLVSASGSVALGPHLRVSVSGEQAFIHIVPHDPRRTLTLSSAVTVAPTTALSLDLVFQLNDVARQTIGLARVRWRYLPGSDLFLVYRQDLTFDGDLDASVTLKMSVRYDAVL